MSFLVVDNISKSFDNHDVLRNISFEVKKGDFYSLVGPSGCGKSTLLRIIAGLETPNNGKILLDGKDITKLEPQKRDIGFVFQNYALFPNMNVFDNIAFGLKIKKIDKHLIEIKVKSVLEKVKLNSKINSPVYSLSGGEQQRVSLARVIVNEPKLILFDEPLSNLDYLLRLDTRTELKRLQTDFGITSLYVTHDQTEALSLSNEMLVLNSGSIMQKGLPEEIYNSPVNKFTSEFISHSNIFNQSESEKLFNINLENDKILSILQENLQLIKNNDSEIFISEILYGGMLTEYVLSYQNKFYKAVSLSNEIEKFNINDKVKLLIKDNKYKIISAN